MSSASLAHRSYFESVSERFSAYDDIYFIHGKGLEVYLQRDFLNADECRVLIDMIEANNAPSALLGSPNPDQSFRTSHSSPLAASGDLLIARIDARIAEFTGIELSHQEGIEGQRYRVGQQFKPHFDAFLTDQDYYSAQNWVGGQRNSTVMLALNEPEAGGGTLFPTAGIRIRPRAGNLIAWCSLDAHGAINPASLHCGEPVLAGVKYIATKWHRERPFRPRRDRERKVVPVARGSQQREAAIA